MELISQWSNWREVIGRRAQQRRYINEFLQTRPAIAYLGDSWFSTPLYPNLAKQSARSVDGLGFVAGKPGGLAAQLFSESQLKSLRKRLIAYPFDVLVVSAGGNDSLSRRLEKVFAAENGPLSPRQAFDKVVRFGIFSNRSEDGGLLERYQAMLEMAAEVQKERPHFRVVGHGYAPLKRIGAKAELTVRNVGLIAFVKGDVGPWLWNVMERLLENKQAGREFAQMLLVEGFRDQVLNPLRDAHSTLFDFADFSTVAEAATDEFWNDEIHPTESGFATLAPRLNKVIAAALPPIKQGAVA